MSSPSDGSILLFSLFPLSRQPPSHKLIDDDAQSWPVADAATSDQPPAPALSQNPRRLGFPTSDESYRLRSQPAISNPEHPE